MVGKYCQTMQVAHELVHNLKRALAGEKRHTMHVGHQLVDHHERTVR